MQTKQWAGESTKAGLSGVMGPERWWFKKNEYQSPVNKKTKTKTKIIEPMASSTKSKLKWFKIIQTAHEYSGSHKQDEFSYNHTLQKWAGLCPQ